VEMAPAVLRGSTGRCDHSACSHRSAFPPLAGFASQPWGLKEPEIWGPPGGGTLLVSVKWGRIDSGRGLRMIPCAALKLCCRFAGIDAVGPWTSFTYRISSADGSSP
jgi:hypothetical protein